MPRTFTLAPVGITMLGTLQTIATADNCGARKKGSEHAVSTGPVVAELERVTQ